MPAAVRPVAATLALLLVLGACAPKKDAETSATAPAQPPAADGKDTCGAAPFQQYVGKRIDALNAVTLPAGSRVLFPTTPATMDFREERLNIAVDKSDTITRAFCG